MKGSVRRFVINSKSRAWFIYVFAALPDAIAAQPNVARVGLTQAHASLYFMPLKCSQLRASGRW